MRLRYLIALVAILKCILSSPTITTTEKVEILTAESITENVEGNSMKTLADLVKQQTDAIRKIVTDHQKTKESSETKEINENNLLPKEDLEKESNDELKKKCEHLSKIFNLATPLEPQALKRSTEKPRTVEVIPAFMQPNLLNFKREFPTPPAVNMPKSQMSGNYFIFTQNPEMYGLRVNKFSDKVDIVPAASSIEEDAVDPDSNSDDIEYEEEIVTYPPEPEQTKETTVKLQVPEVEVTTVSAAPSTLSVQVTTTTTPPKQPKYKYVRLEPIILKTVVLPTGRSTLFWYRLLPQSQSFVQIPDTPDYENVTVVAQPQNFNNEVALPPMYKFYIDPNTGGIKEIIPIKLELPSSTTRPPTVTTVTPAPYPPAQPQFFINPKTGMIYQNALPHQFIYHEIVKLSTSPPAPPSTTTTTTEKIPLPSYTINIPQPRPQPEPSPSVQDQPEPKPAESNKQFKHEFRFVIPMIVTGTQDQVSNYPYQFDPYAYLPKNQRPATMNLPVPYVPNYHMIRNLAVPNQLEDLAIKKEN